VLGGNLEGGGGGDPLTSSAAAVDWQMSSDLLELNLFPLSGIEGVKQRRSDSRVDLLLRAGI